MICKECGEDYNINANDTEFHKCGSCQKPIEKTAAGIESYLASPQDIQLQYSLETGKKLVTYKTDGVHKVLIPVVSEDYVQYLEKLVVRLAAR